MENKAIPSLTSIFNAGTGTAAGTITISVAEFSRLKDIETRFEILRREMLDATYCPIHWQIILGIEKEIKQKQEQQEDNAKQKFLNIPVDEFTDICDSVESFEELKELLFERKGIIV